MLELCILEGLIQQWRWIFLTVLLALTIAYFISQPLLQSNHDDNCKEPPGNTGLPFLGETLAFIAANKSPSGVYEFIRKRHQRFGPVFKTRIFGKTHVFIPGPEVAKLVLRGEFSDFTKSYIKSMHDAVGEHSLLCVKQQTHSKLRNLLSDLFAAEALAISLDRMDSFIKHSLALWRHQQSPIRVIDYTLDITFKIMCGMLMSVEGDEKLNSIRKDVDHVSDAMLSLPIRIPGTRYYTGIKARRRFMRYLDEIIKRRRRGEEYHNDFLQCLLTKHESRLTDVEVKDNLLTLILAGQTTTAAAMMWTVKYLDENPHVQQKLRVEQKTVRQRITAAEGCHLKLEDVNGMKYASKVIKEVLRMASIVSWMPRVVLNPCTVNGFQVKKGWVLNIDARFMHFDPSLYENPMEFNPSRFEGNATPYSFLAFGAGARTCLGMNLAKLMITVFLHHLVTTYRWKVESEDLSLEPWAHFPRLKNGCPVSVEPIQ